MRRTDNGSRFCLSWLDRMGEYTATSCRTWYLSDKDEERWVASSCQSCSAGHGDSPRWVSRKGTSCMEQREITQDTKPSETTATAPKSLQPLVTQCKTASSTEKQKQTRTKETLLRRAPRSPHPLSKECHGSPIGAQIRASAEHGSGGNALGSRHLGRFLRALMSRGATM